MPILGRLLFALLGALLSLSAISAGAAVPELNAVPTHQVALGPEAKRLVIGFRATPANRRIKELRLRPSGQKIILEQADTTDADVNALVERTGAAMAQSRQVTPSMHVLTLQKPLYGMNVEVLLKKLRADPAVEFADIDQRRYPHTLPNDPLFVPTPGASGQWYLNTPSSTPLVLGGTTTMDLSATDAISAWSITSGSSGTVIADIDTGVRFDHPDLMRAGFGGRLLPGYDFVDQDYSRTTYQAFGTYLIANDGDGWDPDPSDPGDWINTTDQQNALFPAAECPVEDSSWHGTRVAGVLGAIANNGAGISGTTWKPYILPVRALGKCGGYDSDIIAGMSWAVGLSVSGVPDNPYPADIVNLSLGGSSSCPTSYQKAITTLSAMGVLIVASAGNQSGPVEAPGNCAGVLAVAGLRNIGTKVGYSSFGPEVGIAAPAGNCVNSSGPCYRSIDTTFNTGLTVPSSNSYTNETIVNLGTSFSAPIVSGIAALMRSVNANLTPAQLIARIESSATPFPPNTENVPVCPALSAGSMECSCVVGQCGAGMVNALSAVHAAMNPIAVIVKSGGTTFDASQSVAACSFRIASYAWSASGGVQIQSGAASPQVNVASSGTAGSLTLTVTDSDGRVDTGSVTFSASGIATVHAPGSAGTAASACPTDMTVTPAAPKVTAAFSPSTVSTNSIATLTITFLNSNVFALTQVSFTETLPADLTLVTSPAPTTSCAGAKGTITSSPNSVTLAGAIIPARGSCSMTLSVKGATAGTYTNVIGVNTLSTGPAGNNVVSASADLSVTDPVASPSAAGGGGGGSVDWLDVLFVIGVLLAARRRTPRL